jgi:DNA (cytosine-5)-methyltransferase 1
MKFGSVCSGIEAASVAWEPLGWKAAWFSEIEPFPSAVLAHHYPEVPNLGDMTALPARIRSGEVEAPDVFCGGTPCQAFSVAGLRRSLDDSRGNLSLVFCEIADAIDNVRRARGEPECIVFWENVPGVLSTKDNAFGCFLGALAGCDTAIKPLASTGWTDAGVVAGPCRTVAWRVLDAQFFGLAQRRRRVFVVASARDDFDPAAVLLEFDGLRRDSAPRREAGQRVANALTDRADRGGTNSEGQRLISTGIDFQNVADTGDLCGTLMGEAQKKAGQAGHGVLAHAFDARQSAVLQYGDKTGPLDTDGYSVGVMQPVAFDTTQVTSATNRSNPRPGDPCHPLAAGAHAPAVAMVNMQGSKGRATAQEDGPSFTLNAMHGHDVHAIAVPAVAFTTKLHNTASNQSGKVYEEYATSLDCSSPPPALLTPMQVRRLTPVECERLQGFPDGYTAIPWRGKPANQCPDGPRYKALGNSWAVPVVRWIGRRIADAQSA